MPMPVKDVIPHRSPSNSVRTSPTGGLTEFLEPAVPLTAVLYVDTGYVDPDYAEGE